MADSTTISLPSKVIIKTRPFFHEIFCQKVESHLILVSLKLPPRGKLCQIRVCFQNITSYLTFRTKMIIPIPRIIIFYIKQYSERIWKKSLKNVNFPENADRFLYAPIHFLAKKLSRKRSVFSGKLTFFIRSGNYMI